MVEIIERPLYTINEFLIEVMIYLFTIYPNLNLQQIFKIKKIKITKLVEIYEKISRYFRVFYTRQ